MARRTSTRSRGFTLVELLVVVGILSVLIALLMPALARARRHARRVHCAANLRSMGQALMMYTQHTGYYPGYMGFGRHGPRACWPTRLRLYMGGDTKAFLCPSRDERFEWDPAALPPLTTPIEPNMTLPRWATDDYNGFGYVTGERLIQPWYEAFSYGYNAWGTHDHPHFDLGLGRYIRPSGGGPRHERELRASRVKVASEMIAIGDSKGDGVLDVSINPDPSGFDWPGDVHEGGANILFCDGHVLWYPQRVLVRHSLAEPRTHPIRRMWNNDNLP